MVEVETGMVAEGFRCVGFFCIGGRVQAVQAGRHQPVAALLALGFRRLQLVAQRHQFVHLGDDTVLLGEGWEANNYWVNFLTQTLPAVPWPSNVIPLTDAVVH